MNKKSEKIDLKRYTWVMWAGIAVVALLLIRSFAGALSTRAKLNQKLAEFEPGLVTAKAEQEELKERLIYVQSDAYVVQWAHEEARMTQPGETLVVTSRKPIAVEEITAAESTADPTPVPMPELPDSDPATPLMRWWRSITGRD